MSVEEAGVQWSANDTEMMVFFDGDRQDALVAYLSSPNGRFPVANLFFEAAVTFICSLHAE